MAAGVVVAEAGGAGVATCGWFTELARDDLLNQLMVDAIAIFAS